ncbi:MAG: rRNA maturation RNase YbeY [Rickettsiales bacterium]|jgi:probable rRNA maturation factor|nr:rRNA maturation RNase YbeY [Rickettsiales bacterium]
MLRVQITLEDRRWSRVIGVPRIRTMARELFQLVQELLGYDMGRAASIELSLLLTNDDGIRILNRDHRALDSPTNVLSFPTYERELPKYLKQEKYLSLGDLVLSLDSIGREATDQNKLFSQHLAHLILHGILHLLGFNHQEEEDAELMESTEALLLERFGESRT